MAGTVAAGSSATQMVWAGADPKFVQGTLVFTSGVLAGQSVGVKAAGRRHAGSDLSARRTAGRRRRLHRLSRLRPYPNHLRAEVRQPRQLPRLPLRAPTGGGVLVEVTQPLIRRFAPPSHEGGRREFLRTLRSTRRSPSPLSGEGARRADEGVGPPSRKSALPRGLPRWCCRLRAVAAIRRRSRSGGPDILALPTNGRGSRPPLSRRAASHRPR